MAERLGDLTELAEFPLVEGGDCADYRELAFEHVIADEQRGQFVEQPAVAITHEQYLRAVAGFFMRAGRR